MKHITNKAPILIFILALALSGRCAGENKVTLNSISCSMGNCLNKCTKTRSDLERQQHDCLLAMQAGLITSTEEERKAGHTPELKYALCVLSAHVCGP